ncbi:MAG: sensor histidine kinase [Candidatus Paceibacterota bacterium]
MYRLEKELDHAARAVAGRPNASLPAVLPLIEGAPFPLCFADTKGAIARASKPFRALAGNDIATLADLTKKLGVDMRSPHNGTRHERIALRSGEHETFRHFSLVCWPVHVGNETIGTVYALLEHTSAVRHTQEHHALDRELLGLQEALVKSLVATSPNPEAEELLELTAILQNQHRPHPHRTPERFDLVPLVHAAIDEYRPLLRKKHATLTATLPNKLYAIGYHDHALEALKLLCTAAVEHAPAQANLRVTLGKKGKRATFSCTIPGHKVNATRIHEAFALKGKGRKSGSLRLAVARILMSQQHGTLTLTVDEDGLSEAHLSFVAAPK